MINRFLCYKMEHHVWLFPGLRNWLLVFAGSKVPDNIDLMDICVRIYGMCVFLTFCSDNLATAWSILPLYAILGDRLTSVTLSSPMYKSDRILNK